MSTSSRFECWFSLAETSSLAVTVATSYYKLGTTAQGRRQVGAWGSPNFWQFFVKMGDRKGESRQVTCQLYSCQYLQPLQLSSLTCSMAVDKFLSLGVLTFTTRLVYYILFSSLLFSSFLSSVSPPPPPPPPFLPLPQSFFFRSPQCSTVAHHHSSLLPIHPCLLVTPRPTQWNHPRLRSTGSGWSIRTAVH